MNLTNRCTLRCRFCPKFNGAWSVRGYPLRLHREPRPVEVLAAMGDVRRYREVVFCGLGEPTLRLKPLIQVARLARDAGAARIRLNTDGLANLYHGDDILPRLDGLVDAVSVSLNAQNEAVYNRHCRPPQRGTWQACLAFVRRAREVIPQVTVTAIDGLDGVDIPACQAIADELGVAFRRRELGKVG